MQRSNKVRLIFKKINSSQKTIPKICRYWNQQRINKEAVKNMFKDLEVKIVIISEEMMESNRKKKKLQKEPNEAFSQINKILEFKNALLKKGLANLKKNQQKLLNMNNREKRDF